MNLVFALFAVFIVVFGTKETPLVWVVAEQTERAAEKSIATAERVVRSGESCRFNGGPVKQARLTSPSERLESDKPEQDRDALEDSTGRSPRSDMDRILEDETRPVEDPQSSHSAN